MQKLSFKDRFRFSCHKGLSCFNSCCANSNIFLTPYDVLRMKNALGISSEEFLEKYAISSVLQDCALPVVAIKMRDDGQRSCPFVTSKGCMIYEDRPMSCRMYPLGIDSETRGANGEESYFIYDNPSCLGFTEDKEWTVEEWWRGQGIDVYEENNKPYKELTSHDFRRLKSLKIDMFHMTCYNLDRFRRHLFESRFFDLFDIEEETKERIGSDDKELLHFGFRWLRFSLFGENTIKRRRA